MLSINTFDQELASFASFFEWTKLDLGFLYFGIQEKVGWKQQSEKLMKAQFYCKTTIQNYMFLILIVVLVFMLKFLILKKWIKNENSKISMLLIKISSVWSYPTFLLMIYNLFPLFLSNILIDIMNFNNHKLLSFISIIFWSWWLWIVLFMKPYPLSYSYALVIDSSHTYGYYILNFIFNLYLSLLFSFNEKFSSTMLLSCSTITE